LNRDNGINGDLNSGKYSLPENDKKNQKIISRKWYDFFIENALLFGLFIMITIGGFTTEYFFTASNIRNLLIHMSVTGILSVGMMYVMLFGEIDLSVGFLMVFAYFIAIKLQVWVGSLMGLDILTQGTQIFDGSQLLLGILGVVIACIIGLINGVITVYGRVQSFVTTIGMMSILNGFNFVLSKGKSIFLTQSYEYQLLGVTSYGIFPLANIVLLILVLVSVILLKFHLVGKRVYAIGSSREVATLAGINIKPWIIGAFVISGFCAGLAGLFFSSRNSVVDPTLGGQYAIIAIAIAVLGGTTIEGGEGNPLRVLLAGLFLGTLLNILVLRGISGSIQTMIVGITILIGFILNRLVKIRKEKFILKL